MPARQLDPAGQAEAQQRLDRLRLVAATAANDDEVRQVIAELRRLAREARAAQWEPYPWQFPHEHPEGWVSERRPGLNVCDERCLMLPAVTPGVHEVWRQRGGRGTGKTEGAAFYVNDHANGEPCDPRVPGGHRFTIVGPTQADAVASCVTGVSGLQAINPGIDVSVTKEGTIVRWPNGAVGRVLGANTLKDVQRARAWTNVCVWWLEEAAAQPLLGGLNAEGRELGMLDQAPFTLRLGPRPHIVATTTPTGRPEVTNLLNWPGVETWGRTEDADKLPEPVRIALVGKYGGTTLGRQELGGEQIGDVTGALWIQTRNADTDPDDDRPALDNDRVPLGSVGWSAHGIVPVAERQGVAVNAVPNATAPVCDRVVVGVDPAGGSTENGISVVGTLAGHGYVLADLTLRGGPSTWGKVAVLAAYEYGAVGIALERTYGGDQTDFAIATAAEALGLPVPAILDAATTVGKKERAMPVQALAQQHLVHMVGVHPKLEGELTTWVEEETTSTGTTKRHESPNRLDAFVHAARFLMVRARAGSVSNPAAQAGRQMRSTWGR